MTVISGRGSAKHRAMRDAQISVALSRALNERDIRAVFHKNKGMVVAYYSRWPEVPVTRNRKVIAHVSGAYLAKTINKVGLNTPTLRAVSRALYIIWSREQSRHAGTPLPIPHALLMAYERWAELTAAHSESEGNRG